MTGFDNENELEDFLQRRPGLHQRLADSDRIEPPPELDRLVLTKAREAIQTPSNQAVYRSPRWALPVALAATIVLALGVVLNFGRLAQNGARSAAPTIASGSAQARAADAMKSDTAPAPAPAPAEPMLAKKAAAAPRAVQVAPTLSAKAENAPLLASAGSTGLVQERDARFRAPRQQYTASANAALSAQITDRETASSSPAATAGNSPHAPASRAVDEVALSTAPARTETDAEGRTTAATRAKHADAQAWLREIEQLRAAGKIAEANQELEEFRKAFPGSPASEAAGVRPPTK